MRAVQNYKRWAEAMGKKDQYRFNAGNFFGRDAHYKGFMVEGWQPPVIGGLPYDERELTPKDIEHIQGLERQKLQVVD